MKSPVQSFLSVFVAPIIALLAIAVVIIMLIGALVRAWDWMIQGVNL